MVLITPLICFVGSILVEVVAHVAVVGVSVFLGLLLYLFFCLLCGSYVAPLGVLQVLLMLGGWPIF